MTATLSTCPSWCTDHLNDGEPGGILHRSGPIADSKDASIIIEQNVELDGSPCGEMYLFLSGRGYEAELTRAEALALADALVYGAANLAHRQGVDLRTGEPKAFEQGAS